MQPKWWRKTHRDRPWDMDLKRWKSSFAVPAQAVNPPSARFRQLVLDLTVIRDVTPVPHNGCRPPKQRRV